MRNILCWLGLHVWHITPPAKRWATTWRSCTHCGATQGSSDHGQTWFYPGRRP